MPVDTPVIEAASTLTERVYRLLLDAHRMRLQFDEVHATSPAEAAECDIYRSLTEAVERGLLATLEDALGALKGMRGAEAEAWLRKRLGELRS